jgi:DNA polymerase-3 subunit epsilon
VLIEALAGRVLVAHVAAVERAFLGAALSAVGEKLRNPIVDTAALDQQLRRLRGQPAASDPVGLSEMARALGLPVHRPHEADGDALTTAQAFIALASHLDEFELQTVGSLRRVEDASRRPGLISRFRGVLRR